MKINKFKIYDITAIVLNAIVAVLTIFNVIYCFVDSGIELHDTTIQGIEFFKYFTVQSNLFLGIVCGATSVIKLINIKKERYKLPIWFSCIKLIATTTIVFVFLAVVAVLGPKNGFEGLFEKENIIFHVVNPIIAYVSYVCFEESEELTFKQCFFSIIPSAIYNILYLVLVFFTKTWTDFYQLGEGLAIFAIPISALADFGIAFSIVMLKDLVAKIKDIKTSSSTYIKNGLDAYTSKIFKSVFIIIPVTAIIGAFTFTAYRIAGLFQDIPIGYFYVFDILSCSTIFNSLFFISKSFDSIGKVKKNMLKRGKIVLAILIFVQWNFVSYCFPTQSFWAYAMFYVLLVSFFFDYKLVDIVIAEIVISIAISWIFRPELLPVHNEFYVTNIILRIICLCLSFATIHIVTFFGGNFLVTELEKLSNFDALTLLMTRRKMDKILSESYSYSKMTKDDLCLAMIDIDDFKMVNDRYGHEKGDEVLKAVSNVIRTEINENDLAFRYGGEEILIVFKTNANKSYKTLTRILYKIKSLGFAHDTLTFHVTVTVGLAAIGESTTYENLIELADKKLYVGKNNGKNQIVYDIRGK